jgi:hypothetical protein
MSAQTQSPMQSRAGILMRLFSFLNLSCSQKSIDGALSNEYQVKMQKSA